MSGTALHEAVKARLQAQPGKPVDPLPVYVAEAPKSPGPVYLILHPDPGMVTPRSVAASHSNVAEEVTVMAISNTAGGALNLAAWARWCLVGWNPNPADTSQSPLAQIDRGPVLPERDGQGAVTKCTCTTVYRAHRRRKQVTP